MYKAALFDLDGTLLNTLSDIADSMNRALAALGLPAHDVDKYRYFVGNGVKLLVQRAVGDHPALWAQAAALYQADYEKNSSVSTRPYNGIMDLLKALNAKKVPVAVFSNKPHADTLRVVRHYFPDIAFAFVRGQMAHVPVKPDPAGAVTAAREIGLPPESFVYAGDTDVDMLCANAAGMTAVGVTWGFRGQDELKKSGAAFIADAPQDILQLFT